MIITICGSKKYRDFIVAESKLLGAEGHCVFTPTFVDPNGDKFPEETKTSLAMMIHAQKILMSDLVIFVKPFGNHTLAEMKFSEANNKQIKEVVAI